MTEPRILGGALCRIAAILALGLPLAGCAQGPVPRPQAHGPSKVEIVEEDGRYRLLVNGAPFRVKGAGLESGSQEELAARGGNAFRTWRPGTPRESGRALLDRAQRNGLFVALGLQLRGERHGFDFNDKAAVAAEVARIRGEVAQYKDHPALLMWVVGNELNLEATNPAVWDAVDQIAEMIHEVDPNHPVMTTLAGIDRPLIEQVKARADSLDLIGIQIYGDIAQLPEKLRESGWTGPYLVTEWGPTGHWESPSTAWGAPIEDDSSTKAGLLEQRYRQYIDTDHRQGLGSFVFLWGSKQERTPTWYGLFLPSGESTPSVDAMQRVWTGRWPDNRSPSITPIEIDGQRATDNIRLTPDRAYTARVTAKDPDGDRLAYRWKVLAESTAKSIGGDPEAVPPTIPARLSETGNGEVHFDSPSQPGAYRLFVEVHDGHGNAGYANVPFQVSPAPQSP
ncbi:glycoside hydrolase family 2 TIM barrel-domain containing protein [Lysobacter korlensis]|uniref:Glycoside hydrolase family 2 TIM barrel-domain containing protein n=1 Tax=Lysobacter korlensis TaxID=553636 RepID=A0ABV6RTV5_9GAMM